MISTGNADIYTFNAKMHSNMQQFTFLLYMIATRPHGQAQNRQERKDQTIQVVGGDRGELEVGWVVTTCNGKREGENLK